MSQMSADLAVACRGSGLAQGRGPCPCQGEAGTATTAPGCRERHKRAAWSSAGHKGKPSLAQGRLAASPGPRPLLGPPPRPWGPAEAALSGSGAADHGLLQQPLAPAPWAQLALPCSSSSANPLPQRVHRNPHEPQGEGGLTKKGDRSTSPTHSPAWARSCTGSVGLGHCTPIPRPLQTPLARAASLPHLPWATLPFPSSSARDPGWGCRDPAQ